MEAGRIKRYGKKDDVLPELLGTASAVGSSCSKLA